MHGMISTIAEHSVDLDLLPKCGRILDLGCLGFQFADEMTRLGHSVYLVDIQDLEHPILKFWRCAISNYNGTAGVKTSTDKQAFSIVDGDDVPCYDLFSFMELIGVGFFDLIKMDVEGSEREIIMSLEAPPCKQLSIEFHLHTGKYTMNAIQEMEYKLGHLGYRAARHEMDSRHGCGMNYWDSLFILDESRRKEYSEPTNY